MFSWSSLDYSACHAAPRVQIAFRSNHKTWHRRSICSYIKMAKPLWAHNPCDWFATSYVHNLGMYSTLELFLHSLACGRYVCRQIYSPSFKMASVEITCSLPERADEISLAKVKLAAIYIMSIIQQWLTLTPEQRDFALRRLLSIRQSPTSMTDIAKHHILTLWRITKNCAMSSTLYKALTTENH